MADEYDADEIAENQPSINRRRVIKALGASGVVGLSGTSTAARSSAASTHKEQKHQDIHREVVTAVEEFSSTSEMSAAIENHAIGSLRGLRNLDRFTDSNVPTFSKMDLTDLIELVNEEDMRVSSRVEERGISAELLYSESWSNVDLSLTILPHFGESYAVVDDDDLMTTIKGVGEEFEREDYTLSDDMSELNNAARKKQSGGVEPSGNCLAGSACKFNYETYDELRELYCCYDVQGNCYSCRWGHFKRYCTNTNCDFDSPDYNSCSHDCYCGEC